MKSLDALARLGLVTSLSVASGLVSGCAATVSDPSGPSEAPETTNSVASADIFSDIRDAAQRASASISLALSGADPSVAVGPIKGIDSGLCVFTVGTADLGAASQYACLGSADQTFAMVRTGNADEYFIQSKNSGKCLDVSGARLDEGAPIIQYACTQSNNQRFVATKNADGSYQLVAKHSGLCLDVPGWSKSVTQLDQWSCNGGANQHFALPPAPPKVDLKVAMRTAQTIEDSATDTGTSTVSSNPTGVACAGADCQGAFWAGTQVQLIPHPSDGYYFVGWEGACQGQGKCVVAAAAAASVTVRFARLDSTRFRGDYTGNTFLKTGNALDTGMWVTIYDVGHTMQQDWGDVSARQTRTWNSGVYAYGSWYHLRAEVRGNGIDCDTEIELNPQAPAGKIPTHFFASLYADGVGGCYWHEMDYNYGF